ncbi:MAG: YneF family protein [Mycoplasmatota bacterium]
MNWSQFFMDLLLIVIGLIGGAVAGFFIAKHYMQKYIKQNPPINEQMIKTMMTQMGRTPSQKQVNQMMKAMTKNL